MKPATAFKGQPVLVLLILLLGWAGFRTVLWEAPFVLREAPFAQGTKTPDVRSVKRQVGTVLNAQGGLAVAAGPEIIPGLIAVKGGSAVLSWLSASRVGGDSGTVTPQTYSDRALTAGHDTPGLPAHGAPISANVQPAARALVAAAMPVPASAGASRWSGDSWLLLRKDTTTAVTAGRGSYGQSQIGAVLRYRILPDSGHRPAAYARASKALAGAGEVEGAVGVSARPVPSVPVTIAAEMRVMQSVGKTYTRPAVYAVTELPPIALPLGLQGEAYAQAGYVGGEFSTPFVDGQLRVERDLVEVGPVEVSAGAGAWGGAQEGVERLDIGPGATVAVDLGDASARVSLDWRFRVAGDAEPSDGPALTISAGF